MSLKYVHPISVLFQEHEEHQTKHKETRSSVTEEWQRNSDNRQQTYCHSDIYHQMEKYYRRYSVTVDSAERRALPFSQKYYPYQ